MSIRLLDTGQRADAGLPADTRCASQQVWIAHIRSGSKADIAERDRCQLETSIWIGSEVPAHCKPPSDGQMPFSVNSPTGSTVIAYGQQDARAGEELSWFVDTGLAE
jgi:hypothetical protein